ncbi:MAG: amino acid transporter [Actinomycetia bacterium]|nr:amino acid transporter [Actinomycetes bacterium]
MGLWSAGIEGFALSMALILAIGPQNIFVLRQGLLRSHVFAVCLVCSLSDALLISAGVLGLGSFLAGVEGAELLISVAAALFIAGYGVLRVRSSMDPVGMSVGEEEALGLGPTIGTALAFTFLNPHVYLDTVLLIGGASSRYASDDRVAFAVGASLASFLFFFALGYGARRLSSVLDRPESWRVIDMGIACVMFAIAGAIMLPFL